MGVLEPEYQEESKRHEVQEKFTESGERRKLKAIKPQKDECFVIEKQSEDEHNWIAEMKRRNRHRTERFWLNNGSSMATSRGTTGGGGSGGGGGFSGIPSGSSSSNSIG